MIDAMKQAMYLIEAWERGAYAEEYPNEIAALRQAIEEAENNQFKPDWDAMAVMVEEQQRMASQIATITHMLKTVNSAAMKLTSDLCRMEVDDDDRVSRDRVMERIVQWRNEWDKAMSNNTSTPLYTSPPRKKWVGLDDEDWMNVPDFQKEGCELDAAIYDWIEARLKEKNT